MMKGYLLAQLSLLCLQSLGVTGIEVAPNSGCSDLCVDTPGSATNITNDASSNTKKSDLVCEDSKFDLEHSSASAQGRKWNQCLTCEASSAAEYPGHQGDNETDVFWFISDRPVNLRYNLAWCVLGYNGNNNSNPAMDNCYQACSNLLQPLTGQVFTVSEKNRFGYCTSHDSAFTNNAASCKSCLGNVDGAQVMGNFVNALQITCEQKPAMGEALDLGFNLFEFNSTSTTGTTTSSSTPSSSATATNTTGDSDNTGTSNATKIGVGVGIGCGGGIVLVGALCLWFFRRSRHTPDAQSESPPEQSPLSVGGSAGKDQVHEVSENSVRPELGSDRRWEVQELSG